MRVAVTGAAGFVGGALVQRLLGRGHLVRAVIRPSHDAAPLRAWGADVARADVRDAEALRRAFVSCDAVVHLAARRTVHRVPEREMVDVNVGGTRAVGEASAAMGVGHLVFGSTLGVFGMARAGEPPRPNTPYRRSKWAAEQAVLEGHDRLPATVVRLPITLGRGTAAFVGFARSVASGRFRLPAGGGGRKSVSDVADVAEALALAVEGPAQGEVYALSGPAPVSVGELATLWADVFGVTLETSRTPQALLRGLALGGDVCDRVWGLSLPRAHQAEFLVADAWHPCDKARRDLGYTPAIGARETARRTLDGYRAAGLFPEVEAPLETARGQSAGTL